MRLEWAWVCDAFADCSVSEDNKHTDIEHCAVACYQSPTTPDVQRLRGVGVCIIGGMDIFWRSAAYTSA
jgi:hypothetical protein